jgi:hypothetical protein
VAALATTWFTSAFEGRSADDAHAKEEHDDHPEARTARSERAGAA